MTAALANPTSRPASPGASAIGYVREHSTLVMVLVGLLVMSLAREISGEDDLTSSGMFGVALRTAIPIAMAGLAGLYAERSGTVNIGLEGMMVMGTIFAGWWGWYFGPWMALLGGLIGGMLGGLLHALATVTFGVNHIVSGFAINILAPGVARFMANELFSLEEGGSITNSPGNKGDIGRFTMPLTSGGDLFGWKSPDPLGWLERRHWFAISDISGLLRGLTANLSLDVIIAIGLIIFAWQVLWRTPFGLRLRSAGEKPSATDSLGVSVALIRYQAMALSGAMAGFGGAVLVLFSNRYQEGQTGGRGFLGLASLILGNWRPGGLLAGAGLFGYAQGITLRTDDAGLVRTIILVAAIGMLIAVIWSLASRKWTAAIVVGALGVLGFWSYAVFKEPNNQFVYIFPYVVVLVVVSVRNQSLRPPAAEGIPYFKGQQT
ncbi:MAG: ABC transporter permease [Actinobacteria bacterium]|nr:ABC transporter permease [Actinomycetota bacterium]